MNRGVNTIKRWGTRDAIASELRLVARYALVPTLLMYVPDKGYGPINP